MFEGEAGTKVVPHKTTGGAFGTISVQRGSAILEVTTLRTDGTYTVSATPASPPSLSAGCFLATCALLFNLF